MKIAVSASGPNLDAAVDPRFGRAPYILIIDPDTLEFDAVPNQMNLQAAQGAGIQTASLVARYKPQAVLTGNCGPKAFQTLQAAGIQVIVEVSGPVRQAVEQYRAGRLAPAQAPNVTGHWG
ncbi:MAG: NifB/NifX family molybdenum-iron cluster-binding protein [Desulfobaccales bacterium]